MSRGWGVVSGFTSKRGPAGLEASERARFEAAVEPLLPRLHRFCLALCHSRQEAEDLLQDALVRAYLRRGDVHSGPSLAWLCGIARNQFLEHRRSVARRRSLLDSVLEGTTTALGSLFAGGVEQPDPEARLGASEEVERLWWCLRQLPEKFRLVVLLCDVEELGHEEAARVLGLPVGTVKSRHSRGRARLGALFAATPGRHADAVSEGGRP
ncbi:RNA polymerase sigma factor [Myxococcus sp. K15C18031901]|uniref:RNA polymerase sigma factor n=1 Tax=Myxococcus dinghuensis TaxID=2906761 RepID=UPI0020A74AD6|nr:sigma-70 family RNA polymerase sigma factor [Myxococcus dinghuensis]MCP3100938.1 RNA polymerase sigma factor [Myxococcus dinghuensis]